VPTNTEFLVLTEDRSGVLAQVFSALGARDVNILALQSFPTGENRVTRFVVDNPTRCKEVLVSEGLTYAEAEVVQAKIPHRPGEIARVASLLVARGIDIKYVYCGLEADTNAPVVFFSVSEIGKAASLIERTASASAKVA
jgi:hypothetical protein